MLKKGDKVRIRNLSKEERYGAKLHYNSNMINSEGLEGVILTVEERNYGVIHRVKTKRHDEWKWLPEWLEKPTEYDAF